nr:MAG TPA: hypothetical protein [Siphoviridae sp. ctngg6]
MLVTVLEDTHLNYVSNVIYKSDFLHRINSFLL